jgi:AraC-like DNA-binding protein
MPVLPQFREVRVRQPNRFERALGLWVDRIGHGQQAGEKPPARLRQLGQYALVAVESGTGRLYTASGRPIEVNRGEAYMHRPDEGIAYASAEGCSTRWVVWNGPEAALLEKLRLFPSSENIVPGGAELVRTGYARLALLVNREDADAALERKQVVLDLVSKLKRLLSQRHPSGGARGDLTERVGAWLEAQGAQAVTIPDLMRHFHMSPTHFRRIFRAQAGRSPVEFISVWRICKAQGLLARGVPMKEVSEQTGFQDLFYFMRVFKQVTGMTAGQFARRPSHLP